MKIFITGASGNLGAECVRLLQESNELTLAIHEHAFPFSGRYEQRRIHLLDREELTKHLDQIDPDLIINCAGFTQVDRAETEKSLATVLNVDLPRQLAHWLSSHDRRSLIHFSTDYVFEGKGTCFYKETDPVNPLNFYGVTKAKSENEVLQILPRSWVIRTSWLYGVYGKNFVKTMLGLSQEKKPTVEVVSTQVGSPTSARMLAEVIRAIVQTDKKNKKNTYGLYHVVNSGTASWAEFAEEIYNLVQEKGYFRPKVIPLYGNQIGRAAARPENSRLDCSFFETTFDFKLPNWKNSLKEVFDEIFKSVYSK